MTPDSPPTVDDLVDLVLGKYASPASRNAREVGRSTP
jgi:hypothetical protein